MSYTKPKMLDQSGTYILDELNPDAPSAAEYARLSNENRELEQIIDALMELRQEAFIQTGKSLDHDSDIDAAYWDGKATAFYQAIDLIKSQAGEATA